MSCRVFAMVWTLFMVFLFVQPASADMYALQQESEKCGSMCESALKHLKELGGTSAKPGNLQAIQDCMEKCRNLSAMSTGTSSTQVIEKPITGKSAGTAKVTASKGPLSGQVQITRAMALDEDACRTVVAALNKCAAVCDTMKGDEIMRNCAEECQFCMKAYDARWGYNNDLPYATGGIK